jgi:hypothetical protein
MPPVVDLVGRTFGRLTALSRVDNIRREAAWACRCECGATVTVRGYSLRCGATTSCGCRQREFAAATNVAARAVASQNRRSKPADRVSYRTAHKRIERAKGKAVGHSCVDCGRRAQDWSLRHDALVTHLGNNGGFSCRYSGDPDDYDPRCKACHLAYDRTE